MEFIWNKLVPSKVRVYAWRVLWERIPTISELQRRGILPQNANSNCIFCKSQVETVRHVIFECDFTYAVWMQCSRWMGVDTILSSSPSINLLHFRENCSEKNGKEFAVCVWLCVIWAIWKMRNASIFRHEEPSVNKAFGEVKSRLWSWLRPWIKDINEVKFRDWACNPRIVFI
ncbi:hypothetical protein ACS0TY_018349 [Phlomoides rotata]